MTTRHYKQGPGYDHATLQTRAWHWPWDTTISRRVCVPQTLPHSRDFINLVHFVNILYSILRTYCIPHTLVHTMQQVLVSSGEIRIHFVQQIASCLHASDIGSHNAAGACEFWGNSDTFCTAHCELFAYLIHLLTQCSSGLRVLGKFRHISYSTLWVVCIPMTLVHTMQRGLVSSGEIRTHSVQHIVSCLHTSDIGSHNEAGAREFWRYSGTFRTVHCELFAYLWHWFTQCSGGLWVLVKLIHILYGTSGHMILCLTPTNHRLVLMYVYHSTLLYKGKIMLHKNLIS